VDESQPLARRLSMELCPRGMLDVTWHFEAVLTGIQVLLPLL
jgi:hypothetical protein